MNRFKRELRKRGIKLNSDYPFLPYSVNGKSCFDPGCVTIEGIFVDSQRASVVCFYNVADIRQVMLRNGKLIASDS